MHDLSLTTLFLSLVGLVALSAFFSSSETGMMALNRYRLRHLREQGHAGAQRAARLLERPDRLIGLILLGNNFVNILASSLATVIALRLWGEAGIAVAAGLLTAVILIFAEVAPKTVAALHPERIAFPASVVLIPLLKITYPLVFTINWIANGLLRPLGISTDRGDGDRLSPEELRSVVNEAGVRISKRHREMLVGILDLEHVTVEDIMIPRADIKAVDLMDSEPEIIKQIIFSQHTRLPVCTDDINAMEGVLHLRKVLAAAQRGELTRESLLEACDEPYYVPIGNPLSTQLFDFQLNSERVALAVDEYGEVQGLVTLEDILEEIVGEFTTDPAQHDTDIHPQEDGSYLVDGGLTIRDLNRRMGWELPTDGPKTINGVVLEYLEAIPEPGISLLVAGYPVEIVQTAGHAVKTAKVKPQLRKTQPSEATD
ncbi:MAG: HlyC/CorC family transporter [Pseudomonadota bacterium]